MVEEKKYTPMMMQYLEVKKQHLDAIVFYRLGDFYEMFFDDAKTASQELDLVLTGRNAGVEERVPMCGIPYHAANGYIQRLVQKGYKVAIVEQLENPAETKGIVKRDVIRIVTPGTIMEGIGSEKETSYIASFYDYQYGIACVLCEMTTGEVKAMHIDKNLSSVQRIIMSYHVKEIVIEDTFDAKLAKMMQELPYITISNEHDHTIKIEYKERIMDIDDERIHRAFGLLTNYLDETQKQSMAHLRKAEMVHEQDFVQMDYATKQNLELTMPVRMNSRSTTLWGFLDKCRSAMGSRCLRKWIEFPLIDIQEICKRQDAIAFLNKNFIKKDELKEHLSYVYDIERLSARIAYGNANPRDIQRLAKTLQHAPQIFALMQECESYEEFRTIDTCEELLQEIDGIIVEEAPISIKDGGIFADGYNKELDEVRKIGKNGKDWILELEQKERERTGIKSLKIGYNRVFGYYIEVTKANLDQIKEEYGYVRKQTLTNAERYITEELKEKEDAIVHAQERSIRMETELFLDLLKKARGYLIQLHAMAHALATIDALYALAEVSNGSGYVRPVFHEEAGLELDEARHPILETLMKQKRYVSNSLHMDENVHIMMITGPNMGGKSTFMRQTALLVIMAQIGCYVPARKACLPIFDKIFTRIGASDDIMSGQSTFMVEMMEANHALQHATKHSLILFDEIGRGTSTYDGMALAQAMIEYIDQNIGAKTLFSTHYHELTGLEASNPSIHNIHVEVHEENEQVTFLYRMLDGKADRSYGINVARLAKLPESVLDRAKALLEGYEIEDRGFSQTEMPIFMEKEDPCNKEIRRMLDMVDVNSMTPMEALQMLNELKKKTE